MIDVQLHDLVLGVVTLDLQRQHPFIHFAFERLFAGEEKILCELLCQRRSAFNFFLRQIVPRRADDAHRVDAHVIVEAHVFDGENRVLHDRRNLFVFERDAFLERELSDDCLAIIGINARHQTRPVSRQCGDFAGGRRIGKSAVARGKRPTGGREQRPRKRRG